MSVVSHPDLLRSCLICGAIFVVSYVVVARKRQVVLYVQAMMERNLNAYNCASETLARPVTHASGNLTSGSAWQIHLQIQLLLLKILLFIRINATGIACEGSLNECHISFQLLAHCSDSPG